MNPDITQEPYGTCDWGDCDQPAADWRYWPEGNRWLPVCYLHMPPWEPL